MEKQIVEEKVTFEDAITRSGFGLFNYVFITMAGGLMACAFIELTSVNFILPIAQCDLDLSTSDKGILSAIGYVGIILSSHLWGFLADTRGRRATLIPTLLIATLATIASSLVNNFWLLVFLRFVNGFFITCASSTTFAYLGEFHDASSRTKVIMIASIFYAIINILLPTFALVTINQEWSFYIELFNYTYKPWRLFLVICTIPNIVCVLALIFVIPESPKYTFSQGDEAETLRILQKIYCMNTGKSAESFGVKSIIKDAEFNESTKNQSQSFFHFMWSQSAPLFKGTHLRNILTASFMQFSVCNAANGFWTFFPEILNKMTLWTDASRGQATVCEIFSAMDVLHNQTDSTSACVQKLELSTYTYIFEIIALTGLGYVIMSLVINWVGKLAIIEFNVMLGGVSALLLIFIETPMISSYLYMNMMILSCLTVSVIHASTIELFPTSKRAMAICISMLVGRLGSTMGSLGIGLVIGHHCDYTFLMPTFLLISSGILAFTIPNISKRHK